MQLVRHHKICGEKFSWIAWLNCLLVRGPKVKSSSFLLLALIFDQLPKWRKDFLFNDLFIHNSSLQSISVIGICPFLAMEQLNFLLLTWLHTFWWACSACSSTCIKTRHKHELRACSYEQALLVLPLSRSGPVSPTRQALCKDYQL